MCIGPGPGPDGGTLATFLAKVVITGLETAADSFDSETHINIAVATGVVVSFTIPSIIKIVLETAKSIAEIVEKTITLPLDVYNDCGAVDLMDVIDNIVNSGVQSYAALGQMKNTLDVINDAFDTLHGQTDLAISSADEIRRLRIQQALTAPVGQIVNIAFVLPATEGGFIDTVPVGVRKIVTDTLAAARDVGIAVSAAASTYLAQANSRLASGDHLGAYRLYQRSYQELSPDSASANEATMLKAPAGDEGESIGPFVDLEGPSVLRVKSKRSTKAATFMFTASEDGSTFECSVDGQDYADCKSPFTTQRLRVGDHSVRVRATSDDQVGQASELALKVTPKKR